MPVQHTLVGARYAPGMGHAVVGRIRQDSCSPEGSRHLSTLGSWDHKVPRSSGDPLNQGRAVSDGNLGWLRPGGCKRAVLAGDGSGILV